MPSFLRAPGEPDPSFFGMHERVRQDIAAGYYGNHVKNFPDRFRAMALSSLEEDHPRFPRGDFSTDFPELFTRRQFETKLKPALEALGIKWCNYGFDPVDGFVMNFFSSDDAVAAKLAYEPE